MFFPVVRLLKKLKIQLLVFLKNAQNNHIYIYNIWDCKLNAHASIDLETLETTKSCTHFTTATSYFIAVQGNVIVMLYAVGRNLTLASA